LKDLRDEAGQHFHAIGYDMEPIAERRGGREKKITDHHFIILKA